MWLSHKGKWNNNRNVHLGLARKGHEIIIVTRILAKIKSSVKALAARRKILKQVNVCNTFELMPPFRHNIFDTSVYFQPMVKQIVVIKFMKFTLIYLATRL